MVSCLCSFNGINMFYLICECLKLIKIELLNVNIYILYIYNILVWRY